MKSIPSRFARFELTEEESKHASTFTLLNIAKLQNLRADIMDNRANLEFDALNPIAFAQSEALLKGQLQILELLIDEHEEVQTSNMQLTLESQQSEHKS